MRFAPRPNVSGRGSDKENWIRLIQEDELADRQIKWGRRVKVSQIAYVKGHMVQTHPTHAAVRKRNGVRGLIDSDNRSTRADDLRCMQGNRSCTAAKIKHAHAFGEARLSE
jgi:hypothetical protein